jgi:mono/diheme cytochrome c family protein
VSLFQVKSVLAALLIVAAVVAATTMLSLMGRSKRRVRPEKLRAAHRAAGYLFAVLVVVLAVLGVRYLASVGDQLSIRAVLHWVLALFLIVVLALKIGIVRFYSGLAKFAPALGMIVFTLALVVAGVSAGFFVVAGEGRKPIVQGAAGGGKALAPEAVDQQTIARGAALFTEHCASCHNTNSEEWKIGPGLRGVLVREALVSTGMPATRESVTSQIVAPVGSMPAFGSVLTEREILDVVTYLGTL